MAGVYVCTSHKLSDINMIMMVLKQSSCPKISAEINGKAFQH